MYSTHMVRLTLAAYAVLNVYDTLACAQNRDAIATLEPWSRTEVALLGKLEWTRQARRPRLSTRDFLHALKRERPNALAFRGGPKSYIENMSIEELRTFKGFTYEQSVLRRWNRRTGPMRYEFAAVGDQIADILERDSRTARVRKYQVYSGANPRVGIEKLLLSDSGADKLIVPRNCYDAIVQAFDEANAIWMSFTNGRLDRQTAVRQARRRLASAGLKLDEPTGEIYAQHNYHGRESLGKLGTSKSQTLLRKLVADRPTSDQIYLQQLQARLELEPAKLRLAQKSGGQSVTREFLRKYEGFKRSGASVYVSGEKAANWLIQVVRDQNAAMDRNVRRALISGVSSERIEEILATARSGNKPSRQNIERMNSMLQKETRVARRNRQLRAQGVLLVFAGVISLVRVKSGFFESFGLLESWSPSDIGKKASFAHNVGS